MLRILEIFVRIRIAGSVTFLYGSGSRDPCLCVTPGSVTLLYGSGSRDPCLWPMDPEPCPAQDLAIFCYWPSRLLKNLYFCLWLFKGTLTLFVKDKNKTVGIKVFLTIFCLMIEGPMTNGSGSGSRRPKKHKDRLATLLKIPWDLSVIFPPPWAPDQSHTCRGPGQRVRSRPRCTGWSGAPRRTAHEDPHLKNITIHVYTVLLYRRDHSWLISCKDIGDFIINEDAFTAPMKREG